MSDDIKKEAAAETKPELSELDRVKAERDEYLAGWQRAKADVVNARKRMEDDMKAFRAIANEGLIEELLPVLQSFEMAFANKDAWEKVDKNWRAGVEHIHAQIKGVLASHGLVELDPVGAAFDPNMHEAVTYEKVEDPSKADTVVRVIERGYSLGGKLVRPAKVVVGERLETERADA